MRNKNKIATYNKPACEASKTNLKLSVQFKRSFFIITCISFTRIFWRKLIVQKKKHSCLITKTFPRILGKESEIPSGGILIWNRRLFVVWIQFTRSICLQHTEEPFLFHFQIFAQVCLSFRDFNWLSIRRFFKKLIVLVMWFFEEQMSV